MSDVPISDTKSNNIPLYALLPVVFILGLGLGYLLWGRSAPVTAQQTAAAPTSPAPAAADADPTPQKVVRYDVPVDDDPSIGPEDAVITLIEFSDYECPFCQRWHTEVFAKIREQYPDKVRLVYRDFPLPSHAGAAPAAQAANCAYEQGAFWEYHELLFSGAYSMNATGFKNYASQLGLDEERFNECVDSNRYRDEVQADLQYAANLGVNSTPTFFLNGIPIVGAQPFEIFQRVIEMELAGEIPK